ncbi:MAG TPA: biliverdin-producing heme oxygenase [Acidimicrobiales bacterium]|nr:biliverdin-producing heme oxygenase [Acidimicrobiales bacterium]
MTEDSTKMAFSEVIRMATAGAHRGAERSGFLAELLTGELPVESYGRLIVQHRAIYKALESFNWAMAMDDVAGEFVQDDVVRLPALDRDVVAVLGDDWQDRPEALPVPATLEYCDRIREVGNNWPAGWVAHQYVRYLGDLSGGFYVGSRIESVFELDSSNGTAFYDFPHVDDPDAWKEAYRRRLDEAPWDQAEQERIVAEVLEAYRLNTEIFAQLAELG